MINFNRVFAMVTRYFINLRHNYDRLGDMFYWPAMDLFIWGLTGLYFARLNTQSPHLVVVILTGIVFWIVIWRVQYEVTTNLLAELWDQNLINIFASPLKVSEWILSVMIFGVGKMIVSLLFSALLAFIFFGFSIFIYGFLVIPVVISLLLTGWAAGFFVSAFIIRYGLRIQTLAWMGIFVIAPFSVMYYPLSILPQWAQKVALFVPPSYIFEGMREIVFTGTFSYDKLFISFALNAIYLILSLWFFVFMFNRSRRLGLGRLV